MIEGINMKLAPSIRWFPLWLVLFETGIYLSNDMYLPALSEIKNYLSISHESAQLTLAAWFLGASLFYFVLGPLADHYGRRLILLISGLVFIGSTWLCAFSHTLPLLMIGRFLEGTAVTCISVAGYSSIHELFDQKQAI